MKIDKKTDRERAIENLCLIYASKTPDGEPTWDLVKEISGQPVITPKLKVLQGGVSLAIDALRTSEDPEAIAFIKQYDEVGFYKDHLSIEEISVCAGVKTKQLYGVISSALLEFEEDATKLLLATNSRAVLEMSIQQALTPKGISDREIIHKATGILPTPKGAQIYVNRSSNVQNNLQLGAPVQEAKYLEPGDRLRDVHSAWEQPRLPAGASPTVIDAEIDGMQSLTAQTLDINV